MTNLILKLEVTAGARIDNVARDAIALAAKLGVNVEFMFNGTRVYATPTKTIDRLVAEFHADSADRPRRLAP